MCMCVGVCVRAWGVSLLVCSAVCKRGTISTHLLHLLPSSSSLLHDRAEQVVQCGPYATSVSLYTNQMLANHKKAARYPKTLAKRKREGGRGVKGGGKERGNKRKGGGKRKKEEKRGEGGGGGGGGERKREEGRGLRE